MRTGRMKPAGIFVLLLLTLHLNAQQKYAFTVHEAVDFAIKNVTEIRNLKIDRQLQVAKNNEIKGQAMPQVNGTISMQHYFTIPVTALPDFVTPSVYNVLEKEGVQNGSGLPIVPPGVIRQFSPPGLVCPGKHLQDSRSSSCYSNPMYLLVCRQEMLH